MDRQRECRWTIKETGNLMWKEYGLAHLSIFRRVKSDFENMAADEGCYCYLWGVFTIDQGTMVFSLKGSIVPSEGHYYCQWKALLLPLVKGAIAAANEGRYCCQWRALLFSPAKGAIIATSEGRYCCSQWRALSGSIKESCWRRSNLGPTAVMISPRNQENESPTFLVLGKGEYICPCPTDKRKEIEYLPASNLDTHMYPER